LKTQTESTTYQKASLPTETLNELIINAIQDKKGVDILKFDMRNVADSPVDFYIICNGNNENQVKAIAENIEFDVKKKGNELPLHSEGKQNATWVLVDYFDTVVHVLHHEARKYYNLEKLWNDGKVTAYENL
jgi:ribosome-associated protein